MCMHLGIVCEHYFRHSNVNSKSGDGDHLACITPNPVLKELQH